MILVSYLDDIRHCIRCLFPSILEIGAKCRFAPLAEGEVQEEKERKRFDYFPQEHKRSQGDMLPYRSLSVGSYFMEEN